MLGIGEIVQFYCLLTAPSSAPTGVIAESIDSTSILVKWKVILWFIFNKTNVIRYVYILFVKLRVISEHSITLVPRWRGRKKNLMSLFRLYNDFPHHPDFPGKYPTSSFFFKINNISSQQTS